MSNYRRLISYIYAYEGGVKGKNIGFAKIETRGVQCKITVSVKKIYVGGNDIGVYLLAGEEEIFLGNIFIRGGSGEFRTVVSVSDVEHSGRSMEECCGLTVHDVDSTWRCYTTIWEDAVAHAAEVELGESLVNRKEAEEAVREARIKKAVREIEEEFPLEPFNASAHSYIGNPIPAVEFSEELTPDMEKGKRSAAQVGAGQTDTGAQGPAAVDEVVEESAQMERPSAERSENQSAGRIKDRSAGKSAGISSGIFAERSMSVGTDRGEVSQKDSGRKHSSKTIMWELPGLVTQPVQNHDPQMDSKMDSRADRNQVSEKTDGAAAGEVFEKSEDPVTETSVFMEDRMSGKTEEIREPVKPESPERIEEPEYSDGKKEIREPDGRMQQSTEWPEMGRAHNVHYYQSTDWNSEAQRDFSEKTQDNIVCYRADAEAQLESEFDYTASFYQSDYDGRQNPVMYRADTGWNPETMPMPYQTEYDGNQMNDAGDQAGDDGNRADFRGSQVEYGATPTEYAGSRGDYEDSQEWAGESQTGYVESQAGYEESQTDYIESQASYEEIQTDYTESQAGYEESQTDYEENQRDNEPAEGMEHQPTVMYESASDSAQFAEADPADYDENQQTVTYRTDTSQNGLPNTEANAYSVFSGGESGMAYRADAPGEREAEYDSAPDYNDFTGNQEEQNTAYSMESNSSFASASASNPEFISDQQTAEGGRQTSDPVIAEQSSDENQPVPGNPDELERLRQMEEEEENNQNQIWERLRRERTKIFAFDYEKGCEILTIKPQDIGLLPREVWVYGNNSFLLHGYYNYRYLILAKLNNPQGIPRFLLGVPGHYYSNERYMASMFGFPNFVLSKDQPAGDGRFGYWYTDIKVDQ